MVRYIAYFSQLCVFHLVTVFLLHLVSAFFSSLPLLSNFPPFPVHYLLICQEARISEKQGNQAAVR